MLEFMCRRCRGLTPLYRDEPAPKDGHCSRCQEVLAAAPAASRPAPVFGWEVTYTTGRGETHTAHYVGTERTARRRTLLRRNARDLIQVEAYTEEAYKRAFGWGRT